jgi:nitrate reductase delta subunit
MNISETYASLSRMLDYPAAKEGLAKDAAVVSAFLENKRLDCAIDSFAAFVVASPLATVQEAYVATFDFNPTTAPYLGHHLFGDNQKKGEYMIGLKQEYARHGFTPTSNELPDHLSLVLAFLAHLARDSEDRTRQPFIAASVLPGLERLDKVFADRRDCPWKPLVDAVHSLCALDGKEVTPC